MRNQPQPQKQVFNNSSSSKNPTDLINKCPQKKQAIFLCKNKLCDHISYSCIHKSCRCIEKHKYCHNKLSIQSIMNTFSQTIDSTKSDLEKILFQIDQVINQWSQFREQVQTFVIQNLPKCALTANQYKMYQALHQSNTTAKQIRELYRKAFPNEEEIKQKKSIRLTFQKLLKPAYSEFLKVQKKFMDILTFSYNNQSFYSKIIQDSKIEMSFEDGYHLYQMFMDNPPRKANLLYRASQQEFKAAKFHQLCDDIPNTLTLCQTRHGNQTGSVIGGYTPLVWNCLKGESLKDESGRSFIFSLTGNHKFVLDKDKNAISPNENYGPCFGSNNRSTCLDLGIVSSGDRNNSQAIINQSYKNENYNYKQSQAKFTGRLDNPSTKYYQFKIKEWEVWELEFD